LGERSVEKNRSTGPELYAGTENCSFRLGKETSHMCDYSLHAVASRPAKAGERLVSTGFPRTATRGFAATDNRNVAVCLLPGTELAFEKDIECSRAFFFVRRMGASTARFRQLEIHDSHRDALELPDGRIVMVTDLRPNQYARVLQLPATGRTAAQPHEHAPHGRVERQSRTFAPF
jgi:hypothetical protein